MPFGVSRSSPFTALVVFCCVPLAAAVAVRYLFWPRIDTFVLLVIYLKYVVRVIQLYRHNNVMTWMRKGWEGRMMGQEPMDGRVNGHPYQLVEMPWMRIAMVMH